MQNANAYALFHSRFPKSLNAIFLEHETGTLSYSEIDDLAAKAQRVLETKGVEPGDRVVVQVEKSAEAVILYLACLRSGAVFIPLNIAYTPTEIAYFLEDSTPKVFVCGPEMARQITPLLTNENRIAVLTLDDRRSGTFSSEMSLASPSPEVFFASENDIAAILYTSGTTGRSKGAMLSHGNLTSNVKTLHDYWGFVPDDVLYHALPIFHAHGLFVALHCAMFNGSKVIFEKSFAADRAIELLPRATVMMGVPTFYSRLLENPAFTAKVCENIRLFISGSAPLQETTFDAFEQRTGFRILERYGMTEALMITSNPYLGTRAPGSVGFSLPGVSVRVAIASCDTANNVTESTGILEIQGPNVFKGYWNMPKKTAQEFTSDGWFKTGDLARIDKEGRVFIVGRAKDLVISGGYNVYPKEVEVLLDEINGVAEAAVFGVPHPDFGEGVTAAIVLEPGVLLTEDEIKQKIAGRIAKFKQPKTIKFVGELPRNSMGKIQKNVLREKYQGLYSQST